MVDIVDHNDIKFIKNAKEYTTRKDVDFFRTTVPSNINHYLEHRGLDADDVLGITRDGGIFYVFFKKTSFKEIPKPTSSEERRRKSGGPE